MPKRKRSSERSARSLARRELRNVGQQLANVNVRKADLYRVGAYLKAQQPNEDTNFFYGTSWRKANQQQRQNRMDDFYVGRGRYNIMRSLGRGVRKAAKFIAPYAKEAAKDAALGLLGAGLYTGRGAYKANTLFSHSEDKPMRFSSKANDETESVVFTHREYIGDIFGPATSGFNNQSYELNPGLSENFPWLSQIAVNYEEYEWKQLVFEYHSTIDSSTVTNGQTGTLIMATQYNTDNKPFTSKDTMLQYAGSMSSRLTEDMVHGVECDPRKLKGDGVKYVRATPIDKTIQELDDYDVGRFELAINNCPTTFANQAIGELWVHYSIKLMKPKIGANKGLAIQQYKAIGKFGTPEDLFGLTTNNLLLGLNSLNCKLGRISAVTGLDSADKWISIEFPANFSGRLRIELLISAASMTGDFIASPTEGPATRGNVKLLKNQLGAFGKEGEAWYRIHFATASHCIILFEVDVSCATGGVPNLITMRHDITFQDADHHISRCTIHEVPNDSISESDDMYALFRADGTRGST